MGSFLSVKVLLSVSFRIDVNLVSVECMYLVILSKNRLLSLSLRFRIAMFIIPAFLGSKLPLFLLRLVKCPEKEGPRFQNL